MDDIGNGTIGDGVTGAVEIDIIRATTDRDEFIEFVFPQFKTVSLRVVSSKGRAVESLRSSAVDEFNDYQCSFLKGQKHTLYSVDTLNAAEEMTGEQKHEFQN